MIRAYFTAAFILLCFALFESAILSNVRFLPAVPDFLLLCVLYFSYNGGRMFGVATGYTSGLFLDFLTAAPFGLHCMLRTIIGWATGFLNGTINIDGVIFPAILAFIATLLKAGLLRVIALFFPISVSHYDMTSEAFIAELAMNTILCPLVFKFISIFNAQLSTGKEA